MYTSQNLHYLNSCPSICAHLLHICRVSKPPNQVSEMPKHQYAQTPWQPSLSNSPLPSM